MPDRGRPVTDVDCLVVGLGVNGAAALYHLARAGRRPVGLDRFAWPHTRGSSHGRSRALSMYYGEPPYAELVQASRRLWLELAGESGRELFIPSGMLVFDAEGSADFAGTVAGLGRHGTAHEVLDPGAVARRFPRLRIPDGTLACLLPDAGFLDADLCVAELLATATRHGATVHAPAPALHLDLGGRRPVVVGADRAWRCESLVLAPGPWAPRLLADTGWPLRPTLQYTCYFEPASPGRYGPGELPVLGDRTTGNYSFPRHGPGIKAAVDRPGPPASPDEPQPPVPAEEVATLRGWLGGLLPGSHPRPLHGSACFYTMTPDRDFIVGRHPRHDRVAVAAGCSGHGFKFGIALGQALAAIATGQPSPWPVDRFDPGRFALAGGTTGGRHDR